MRLSTAVCAVLALGLFAMPAAAQQALPEQPLPAAQPTASADAPPPFPAMPRARPSHRCVNTCGGTKKATHHSTAHREKPKVSSKRPTHERASKERRERTSTHHKATRAERAKATSHKARKSTHEPALHLSSKAIRRCHSATYRQLMKDSQCRALMRQELEASDKHSTAKRHSSESHKKSAAAHKKSAASHNKATASHKKATSAHKKATATKDRHAARHRH